MSKMGATPFNSQVFKLLTLSRDNITFEQYHMLVAMNEEVQKYHEKFC